MRKFNRLFAWATHAIPILLAFACIHSDAPTMAQEKKFVANYDESKVGQFELPPLWKGEAPQSPEEFKAFWRPRRAELVKLFSDEMFGHAPTASYKLDFEVIEQGKAFNDQVLRKQIRVTLSTAAAKVPIDLLLYTPAGAKSPSPAFLGLNFRGNHGETMDPAVLLPQSWVPDSRDGTSENNRATEKGRGAQAHRLPVEYITKQGYAVATAYYGDIDPDFDDGFKNGVHQLFPDFICDEAHPDRWGSIAAWAWGLSRLLDVLEKQPEIDAKKVVVFGHSRLGKTSIWAGATDTRFAGAISNDSGCGGAALNRRIFGETVWRINNSFPHWFNRNFRKYNDKEMEMPFDQHELLALVAPRLLHVASATEDLWADPRGEFLATKAASPVYEKLGLGGLGLAEFPDKPTGSIGTISYHLREGKHDLTQADWEWYVKSAAKLSR